MGAMAYAELAALRPKAGGEYVYLREAYGPLAGFLTGWTSFVAGFSGAIAASAVFFIVTLDRFVPGIANGDAAAGDSRSADAFAITFSLHTLAASGLIVLFALDSHRRRRPGRARQQRADDAEDRRRSWCSSLRADRRDRVAVEPHAVGGSGDGHGLDVRDDSGDVHLLRAGTRRRTWPRRSATRAATCPRRSFSARRRHRHLPAASTCSTCT